MSDPDIIVVAEDPEIHVPPQNAPLASHNYQHDYVGDKKIRLLSPDRLSVLRDQGYPRGLAREIMANNAQAFPLRFWIIDNSGSMSLPNGRQVLGTRDNITVASCSRWKELQETVAYHADMAALLQLSTMFRMLNHPGVHVGTQEFRVGQIWSSSSSNKGNHIQEAAYAKDTISKTHPEGGTPLTLHLLDVRRDIELVAQELQCRGQRAVVIIATDGVPSDANRETFVDVLRGLQSLPVWIVVRMCTDDPDVVEYYNSLDGDLEMPLEVIDDFFGEANEIYAAKNQWLNYALPLHRCRELGYHHVLLDYLDERSLTKNEIVEFLHLLFGPESFARAPNAHSDWHGFLGFLSNVVEAEGKQWNPNTKKMDWWIDINELKTKYTDVDDTSLSRLS